MLPPFSPLRSDTLPTRRRYNSQPMSEAVHVAFQDFAIVDDKKHFFLS